MNILYTTIFSKEDMTVYPTERDFITAYYLRKDMLKQAEKELLIRIAQNNAPAQTPIHHQMLVNVGTWIERLGCRLKSHYMEVTDLEIRRTALS